MPPKYDDYESHGKKPRHDHRRRASRRALWEIFRSCTRALATLPLWELSSTASTTVAACDGTDRGTRLERDTRILGYGLRHSSGGYAAEPMRIFVYTWQIEQPMMVRTDNIRLQLTGLGLGESVRSSGSSSEVCRI